MAVLVDGSLRDPSGKSRYVTRVELAVVVEAADRVDDPRRLAREGVVGEGGDPSSAGVVAWRGSVAVEGSVDRPLSSCSPEVLAERGEFAVDRFLLDRGRLLGELAEVGTAGFELANGVGLELDAVELGECPFFRVSRLGASWRS